MYYIYKGIKDIKELYIDRSAHERNEGTCVEMNV